MQPHQDYMQQALALAYQGLHSVAPNPMVGCILVKDGQIIGEGFHKRRGQAHAEVIALEKAGDKAKGATAYVSLEPCCHTGKTPPCTQALIAAGIKEVYVACIDPNPLVAGLGIDQLKAAGISVHVGLLNEEAQQLNRIFFHYIKTKRPFVFAKWAMSLDGKTITHPKDSKNISSPTSRVNTHLLRETVDAVLVGRQTAIDDDPQLTVRLPEREAHKQPLRIILTSQGQLPLHLKMLQGPLREKTLVVTTDAIAKNELHLLQSQGVPLLVLPKNTQGKINLNQLLDALGELEITSLLIEGGMNVHEAFFKEKLVNEVQVYIAPVFIGQQEAKQRILPLHYQTISGDLFFKGDCHV